MTNTNCLEGIECPKCGNDSRFYVGVRTRAEVTDDGAETFGDMIWDDTSYAECPECEHFGTLGEFQIGAVKPHSTQARKE